MSAPNFAAVSVVDPDICQAVVISERKASEETVVLAIEHTEYPRLLIVSLEIPARSGKPPDVSAFCTPAYSESDSTPSAVVSTEGTMTAGAGAVVVASGTVETGAPVVVGAGELPPSLTVHALNARAHSVVASMVFFMVLPLLLGVTSGPP
jgi:hypothetical protein